jgi:hypothetical protein
MNFAEAMAELFAGRRIRRKSWDKGFYWCFVDGVLREFGDESHAVRNVNDDEIHATDWETQ